MNRIDIFGAIILVLCFLLCCGNLCAENIDPYEDDSQYAYGENVGWLNFEPDTGDGAQVENDKLTGWVWAENIGWVSLSCENTASCPTVNYGVANDGSGNLSGYAWAENVGWINFDPTYGGVTIDSQGNFDGYAWGENIGWINFALAEYYVKACVVTTEDLAEFVSWWLQSGDNPANLDNIGEVDLIDYSMFAAKYLDYCPDGWQLK